MKELKELPPDVILEILSFISIDAKISSSEREFFQFYFGRFPIMGNIEFLFRSLEWPPDLDLISAWQLFRVEQALISESIDLFNSPKYKALCPPTSVHDEDSDWSEEQVLFHLNQLILGKRIDHPSRVRSICLHNPEHPYYVIEWVFENFTELEILKLIVESNGDYPWYPIKDLRPKICILKNLKRLELDSVEKGLSNYFIEISRETPHMEIFENRSLTSIFTAPEIFRNWKNLKSISSEMYKGGLNPKSSEIEESYSAIQQLDNLESISLKGESISSHGVPVCKSLKRLQLSLATRPYSRFSMYGKRLMDTISENTQLTELELGEGFWEDNAFHYLDPVKLEYLTKLSMVGTSNECVEHLCKFTSIQLLDIIVASIDQERIGHLLKLPNLKKIRLFDDSYKCSEIYHSNNLNPLNERISE